MEFRSFQKIDGCGACGGIRRWKGSGREGGGLIGGFGASVVQGGLMWGAEVVPDCTRLRLGASACV